MRRSLALVATVGVMTLTTAACGGSSLGGGSGNGGGGGGDAEAVTIGLLIPQSGVYAPLGTDMENGFRLYLEENDNQLGGKEVTVRVVDEGGGPDSGVPAGQGLARDDNVHAVVGIVNSAVALGLRDSFEEAEKPLIIANAGADAITGDQASDYVWRTSFANSEVSAAIGAHVAEEVGDGTVYMIGPDYAAGNEFLAGFRETFEGAGGQIAGQQLTPFGSTTNFQPYLAQMRNSGAEAAFCFYAGAEAVAFVQQFNQLGLKDSVQLYCSGFVTEGSVLEAQGSAALGIKTSLHYSSELDNEVNASFVEAYSSKYDDPPNTYAMAAYDAAKVLDLALEQGIEGNQIVEGLKGIGDIESPRGTWTFSDTHGPEQTYYLRTVTEKDGTFVNSIDGPLGE